MHLRIAARVVVPALLVLVSTKFTQGSPARVIIDPTSGNGEIGVTITGSHSDTQPPTPSGPIYLPYLVTHTGPSLATSCIAYRVIDPSSAAVYAADLSWASETWNALLAVYPRCSGSAAAPLINALTTWWTVTAARLLPIPRVTTKPDYGIVNTPNYLTLSGATTMNFSAQTPIGAVTISATGSFSIETAAGIQGPYHTLGGPYPWGSIRYTSESPGHYPLTAIETWSATYVFEGANGQLPSVAIAGPTDELPVVSLRGIVGLPSVLG